MLVIWIIALSISIWYTVQQSNQYHQATANPVSTVIIEKLDRLPLPQVLETRRREREKKGEGEREIWGKNRGETKG